MSTLDALAAIGLTVVFAVVGVAGFWLGRLLRSDRINSRKD